MAVGLAVMLGCAALVTGPTPASAVATISLFDGTTTVSVFDGGPGDICPAAGCVSFFASLGVWTVNVSTGLSSSPIPSMDLNSVDQSTGAGTLKILLGDTDFTLGAGPHQVALGSAIGGTTAGSVTWHSGLNDSNITLSPAAAIRPALCTVLWVPVPSRRPISTTTRPTAPLRWPWKSTSPTPAQVSPASTTKARFPSRLPFSSWASAW